MNMKLEKFLRANYASENERDLYQFAKNKTLQQFYNNCERPEWLIWLFARTNPHNSKEIILTAVKCANLLTRLVKKKVLLKALEASLNFEKYYNDDLISELVKIRDAAFSHQDGQEANENKDGQIANKVAFLSIEAAHAFGFTNYVGSNAIEIAELLQKTHSTEDILNIVREHLPFEIWNKKAIRYVKKSVYSRYYQHNS